MKIELTVPKPGEQNEGKGLPSHADVGHPPGHTNFVRTWTHRNSTLGRRSTISGLGPSWLQEFFKPFKKHLNFYRIHVLFFTFTPLICSGIFYAANGSFHIQYIDCLFLCFSAMTVTGLTTVNLSTLTSFQQFLLLLQMLLGDVTAVSLVVVLVRKSFFRTRCEELLRSDALRREKTRELTRSLSQIETGRDKGGKRQRRKSAIFQKIGAPINLRLQRTEAVTRPQKTDRDEEEHDQGVEDESEEGHLEKIGTSSEFPVSAPRAPSVVSNASDDSSSPHQPPPQSPRRPSAICIKENGFSSQRTQRKESIDDGIEPLGISNSPPVSLSLASRGHYRANSVSSPKYSTTTVHENGTQGGISNEPGRRVSNDPQPLNNDNQESGGPLDRSIMPQSSNDDDWEVVIDDEDDEEDVQGRHAAEQFGLHFDLDQGAERRRLERMRTIQNQEFPPPEATTYLHTNPNIYPRKRRNSKHSGYGGFPGPFETITHFADKAAPGVFAGLRRRMTKMDRVMTLTSAQNNLHQKEQRAKDAMTTKAVKWLTFDGLIVGRNSKFRLDSLTDSQLEEIGGVEYRALRLLGYLVAIYWILSQILPFAFVAIYFASTTTYDSVFNGPDQQRPINKYWASLFLSTASYTGAGMSLVDLGFVPLATAYEPMFFLSWAVLAGNHCLPIFLRFTVWVLTKFVPEDSEIDETLHFLLDHPRRCFLYLFPSHQTWYLLLIFILFTVSELLGFLVLNIGLSVVDDLPGWMRFADGMFQSLSVRASGFAVVSVSSLSPALLFLYVIFMYVAVYPIAMSLRSTNVYEERSLGLYERPPAAEDEEPALRGSRTEVFSKYFLWHCQRQLSFDIWPLALGIFLVTIIERTKLMDDENAPWFNLFRIIFELVSGYATIGLSIGIPTENYSFSGSFGPLSKLVVAAVMLRGRHRGLPVAIDRAILLPREYVKKTETQENDPIPKTQTRDYRKQSAVTDEGKGTPQ